MKVVPDTMLWVSYTTHRDGVRHQVLERAWRDRVRLFTSPYILDELASVLIGDFGKNRRYTHQAIRAVLRRCQCVELSAVGSFVDADPADNPIVQTAISAKSDYVVTADRILLAMRKIRDVEFISLGEWIAHLGITI